MIGELIILTLFDFVLFLILMLAKFWNRLCDYFHMHYTYFKILFIILYSLEQAFFIIFSYFYNNREFFNPVITGFFALIVITTVSLQGIMMDSINKRSSDKLNKELISSSEERAKMKLKYENKITEFIGYIEHLESVIDSMK